MEVDEWGQVSGIELDVNFLKKTCRKYIIEKPDS